MTKLSIKETQNPAIIKFEFDDFITKNKGYEFKNIDEASDSPLAQQLFYLPFVKTVFISGNFIAIERYSIVQWDDVKDAVAEQIEEFVKNGGIIIKESTIETKKLPVTIYAESTPNPSVLKFVANKILTSKTAEFKNIDEAFPSALAKELFKFPFVKEIFMDENYISITKYNSADWQEISNEIRTFIKEYVENGNEIINESLLVSIPKNEKQELSNFDSLDTTSQQIINILEEYVKPAVQADGGNILFDSYDESEKRVKVVLQGACSGCPSSTFTLKNGIENMLKDMLNDEAIKVEAING
ncbi:MAG TPA: NifU family protein [Flavobacterium sp.]|uniref:NifU family protein n=1 Tax=unclassified Flavobacterium TaxID=196869 RepID=UPI0025C02358|nr:MULTISPECIES: NifU family protein [unclassified Flavobacterium]HRE76182.1 NifU family protein [Flavobacterium sp.]